MAAATPYLAQSESDMLVRDCSELVEQGEVLD